MDFRLRNGFRNTLTVHTMIMSWMSGTNAQAGADRAAVRVLPDRPEVDRNDAVPHDVVVQPVVDLEADCAAAAAARGSERVDDLPGGIGDRVGWPEVARTTPVARGARLARRTDDDVDISIHREFEQPPQPHEQGRVLEQHDVVRSGREEGLDLRDRVRDTQVPDMGIPRGDRNSCTTVAGMSSWTGAQLRRWL